MKVTKRERSLSHRFPPLLLEATSGLLNILDAPAALCGADDRPVTIGQLMRHVNVFRRTDAAANFFRSDFGARADGGAARRGAGGGRRCAGRKTRGGACPHRIERGECVTEISIDRCSIIISYTINVFQKSLQFSS